MQNHPKISVTFLSSYLYCPRKLYFEQVLKIIKIPKEAIVKGAIRHETYEGINKAEESLVSLIKEEHTYEDIFNEYKKAYTKILTNVITKNTGLLKEAKLDFDQILNKTLPLILAEAEVRSKNVNFFSKKHKLYGKELWLKLTPKILSEVRVESETLGLKGVIDEIQRYENEFVPVELKTGKAPNTGVWEGHKVQIGAYMMLLLEKNSLKVKEGIVKYLDFGIERQIVLDPFLKKEIIELASKVRKLLSQKTLPPKTEQKNKCTACQLHEECGNN